MWRGRLGARVRGREKPVMTVMMRRWCVAGSVLALSAGLALHPTSSSARAGGVEIARLVLSDGGGMSYPTGQTCTSAPGTGTEPELDLPVNGGWRTVHMSRTGASFATSQVASSGDASARVVSDRRGTTRLDVKTAVRAKATPTSASPYCSVDYHAGGGAGIQVAVTRRSWAVLRSTASARGTLDGTIYLGTADYSWDVETTPGKGLTRLVRPRTYQLVAEISSEVRVPAGSTTARSSSASMTANLSIIPTGTRRTHTGSGLAYVTAGHRDCANSRVTMRFTNAARSKARKITFYVNGQRRIVLRGRQIQRSSLLLTRIAPSSAGIVRAEVVLRSGARRAMQSTSWPCA